MVNSSYPISSIISGAKRPVGVIGKGTIRSQSGKFSPSKASLASHIGLVSLSDCVIGPFPNVSGDIPDIGAIREGQDAFLVTSCT